MRTRLLWLLVFVIALLCALGLMVQADEQMPHHVQMRSPVYLRPVEPALPAQGPRAPEEHELLCLWVEDKDLPVAVPLTPFLCQRPGAFLLPDPQARYHAFHLSAEAG